MALRFLFSLRDSGDPRDHDRLCRDADELSGLGFDGAEYVLPSRLPDKRKTSWQVPTVPNVWVVHAGKDLYPGERFADALNEAVLAAILLEAPTLNIHPGSLSFGGRANIVSSLKLIKATQEQYSRRVCCEVLAYPVTTQQRMELSHSRPAAWLADVDRLDVSGTLDTTHIASWGEDPLSYLEAMHEGLGHIHMSDYNATTAQQHVLLGQGTLALVPFLQRARDLYRDRNMTITVEPSRRYFAKSGLVMEVAKQSMEYIQTALK